MDPVEVPSASGAVGCSANCGETGDNLGGRPRRPGVLVGAGGSGSGSTDGDTCGTATSGERGTTGGLVQLQGFATLTVEAQGGWQPEELLTLWLSLPCRR